MNLHQFWQNFHISCKWNLSSRHNMAHCVPNCFLAQQECSIWPSTLPCSLLSQPYWRRIEASCICPPDGTSLTFQHFSLHAYILDICDLNAQCPTLAHCWYVCVCVGLCVTSLFIAANTGGKRETKREREQMKESTSRTVCPFFSFSLAVRWRKRRRSETEKRRAEVRQRRAARQRNRSDDSQKSQMRSQQRDKRWTERDGEECGAARRRLK